MGDIYQSPALSNLKSPAGEGLNNISRSFIKIPGKVLYIYPVKSKKSKFCSKNTKF